MVVPRYGWFDLLSLRYLLREQRILQKCGSDTVLAFCSGRLTSQPSLEMPSFSILNLGTSFYLSLSIVPTHTEPPTHRQLHYSKKGFSGCSMFLALRPKSSASSLGFHITQPTLPPLQAHPQPLLHLPTLDKPHQYPECLSGVTCSFLCQVLAHAKPPCMVYCPLPKAFPFLILPTMDQQSPSEHTIDQLNFTMSSSHLWPQYPLFFYSSSAHPQNFDIFGYSLTYWHITTSSFQNFFCLFL